VFVNGEPIAITTDLIDNAIHKCGGNPHPPAQQPVIVAIGAATVFAYA